MDVPNSVQHDQVDRHGLNDFARILERCRIAPRAILVVLERGFRIEWVDGPDPSLTVPLQNLVNGLWSQNTYQPSKLIQRHQTFSAHCPSTPIPMPTQQGRMLQPMVLLLAMGLSMQSNNDFMEPSSRPPSMTQHPLRQITQPSLSTTLATQAQESAYQIPSTGYAEDQYPRPFSLDVKQISESGKIRTYQPSAEHSLTGGEIEAETNIKVEEFEEHRRISGVADTQYGLAQVPKNGMRQNAELKSKDTLQLDFLQAGLKKAEKGVAATYALDASEVGLLDAKDKIIESKDCDISIFVDTLNKIVVSLRSTIADKDKIESIVHELSAMKGKLLSEKSSAQPDQVKDSGCAGKKRQYESSSQTEQPSAKRFLGRHMVLSNCMLFEEEITMGRRV